MTWSIRRRLVVILVSSLLVAWSVVYVSNFIAARGQVRKVFDAHIAASAHVLFALISFELSEDLNVPDGRAMATILQHLEDLQDRLPKNEYESRLVFQFAVTGGKREFRSTRAPATPLSNDKEGFSDSTIDGETWRVYTLGDPKGAIMVRVGQPHKLRSELVDRIAFKVLFPLLGMVPILASIVWAGVGRGLTTVRQLADLVGRRAPSRLDPIDVAQVPREIQPLVVALNRLFGRLEDALESERRFTADAAHELRTPLAGMKIQAQVAMQATDDKLKQRALQQLVRAVDGATHLVQQLLTLARFDPEAVSAPFSELDLCELLRHVMADMAFPAHRKHIELSLQDHTDHKIRANADALTVMLRNIIENAILYSPDGGRVDVSTTQGNGRTVVHIDDNGPGIPSEDHEKVFNRFSRGEHNDVPGSGLGLSIAMRIADIHGARIKFDVSPANGLRVNVYLR